MTDELSEPTKRSLADDIQWMRDQQFTDKQIAAAIERDREEQAWFDATNDYLTRVYRDSPSMVTGYYHSVSPKMAEKFPELVAETEGEG